LNVAEAHRYEGLHQWNLCPVEENDMQIWNRDHSVRLSELVVGHPISVVDQGEVFVVRVTKEQSPSGRFSRPSNAALGLAEAESGR
jgi:hypothetical protein